MHLLIYKYLPFFIGKYINLMHSLWAINVLNCIVLDQPEIDLKLALLKQLNRACTIDSLPLKSGQEFAWNWSIESRNRDFAFAPSRIWPEHSYVRFVVDIYRYSICGITCLLPIKFHGWSVWGTVLFKSWRCQDRLHYAIQRYLFKGEDTKSVCGKV